MHVNSHDLAAALAALAVPGVVTGARLIVAADLDELHDVERAKVANAVPRRQHEFASGRALLRELLGTNDTIPVGPSRAPHLPQGVVGSLAHDREVVVAAVTRDPAITALGIDVEPAEPLSSDMARVILRDDEAGLDAHLAFTLKEAAYKAWSTGGGRMLDHHEVRLRVDGDRFTATVLPDGSDLRGRFAMAADRYVALVMVP
ncbi:MAG: 4'-phosphopantetheinyl transferase superfamily protein [Actinomycetota bacterium]|nr:4'-phosphopantetheinyl transferase superfamily protein [Actinomycetota bacterium]